MPLVQLRVPFEVVQPLVLVQPVEAYGHFLPFPLLSSFVLSLYKFLGLAAVAPVGKS